MLSIAALIKKKFKNETFNDFRGLILYKVSFSSIFLFDAVAAISKRAINREMHRACIQKLCPENNPSGLP